MNLSDLHYVKYVRTRSISGPYFPIFNANAGKYRPENLRIRTLFTVLTNSLPPEIIKKPMVTMQAIFKDKQQPNKRHLFKAQ